MDTKEPKVNPFIVAHLVAFNSLAEVVEMHIRGEIDDATFYAYKAAKAVEKGSR